MLENANGSERVSTKELIESSQALIDEAKAYLISQGKTYSLDEWITLKEYTKRHNLVSIDVVQNWIDRGNVPAKDVLVITELNNIKFIRNKEYLG